MKTPEIDIKQFRKVLLLEQRGNYNNKAVIGGLDKYVSKWSADIIDRIGSSMLRSRLEELVYASPFYRDWDNMQRSKWVDGLIGCLNEMEGNDKFIGAANLINSKNISYTKDTSPAYTKKNAINLDSPVTSIKGIKTITASKLSKLGIGTIRNLIYHFPRYHIDYSQKRHIADLPAYSDNFEMEPQTVVGNIWESHIIALGHRRMKATEIIFGDETGNASAIWFNQPYMAKQFSINTRVVISGRYRVFKGHITFQSPDWDFEENSTTHAGRLVPIYALTAGLYQRQLRNLIKKSIDIWSAKIPDFISKSIKKRCNLIDLCEAIKQAHFPDSMIVNQLANNRLAFNELFLMQLGMMRKRKSWQEGQPANPLKIETETINEFIQSLPYNLTHAQHRVLNEILTDIGQVIPMSRLLQGDVGSGKTIVALAVLLAAINSGYQGVLMAPTEILAEQHFHNICQLLDNLNKQLTAEEDINSYLLFDKLKINIALLTGKLNEKHKKFLYEKLHDGNINILIGTHAIIQKGVKFKKLGLAVIDEQHRFGVMQRNALRQKGFNPHVLVMTATPIPRTLALTLYGDLDISIIDELPPGRQIIKTRWVKPESRNIAYNFISKQIQEGHQAFIICPLIEESDTIEAKAATAEYDRLSREIFPYYKLGLLHGRMSSNHKDEIMSNFRNGMFNILVSTPVVEVGIDIPNATVILIEAADRFGLSQLHQFRGRVGRGQSQSYCILMAESPSKEARERLSAIEQTQNGFLLAEKDMELRGPGEFLGTRQSGLPDLRMAKLTDVKLIEIARKEAQMLFQYDPKLEGPENQLLLEELVRVWPSITEWS